MEEPSSHNRSSLSGNLGNVGITTGHKPKIQPVRIKKLLESMSSDDESEDRERDSEKSVELDDTDNLDSNKVKDLCLKTEDTPELSDDKEDKAIANLAMLNLDTEASKLGKSHSPEPVQKTFQAEIASVAPASNTTGSSHLVNDTPLKQTHMAGSSRPMPCFSHKNLFMTPQNKVEGDYQINYAPTPATIFSHWSQNRLHTPLQNQVQWNKEGHSTGKSAVQSSNSKQEIHRYYNIENKSVRRPLAETMKPNPLLKETIPNYSFDKKQSSIPYNAIPKIEVPYIPSAVENNQELKENVRPNADEHLNTEIPPKSYKMSDKDLIVPKIMSSNFNEKRRQEIVEESKDVPKVFPTINSENERPKVVQRLPIALAPVIQNNHKDEFLKVKNVQYRNLGIIGKGMCGTVYRVQNLSNNQLQAIKFVDFTNLDKEGTSGCLEEIRMLHKLQAPCIIRMFDFEVKENCAYVVLELGDTDLNNLIKTNAVETDLCFTLYYWKQMLTAVNYIHKNGVIHSDLKPGNFVLVKGILKLIDFGIASSLNGDMTSVVKSSTTGTLNYISPEALTDVAGSPSQNAKHKINFKSDIWSLGCILYSLVYGRTPFHDIRSQWQKISAIQNPKHKIHFPLNSGHKLESVPPVLIDVMKRCLNRDSRARPTAEQLLEVSYISTQPTNNHAFPEIPAHIMLNIKQNRLSEEEWRQFVQLMEKRRRP